jgi:protein-tyrosine-phosphatase
MFKTKVLFVCIHNSARSQMAEALLKKVGGESFEVESAGLEPGKLNPLAVDAMKAIGIDISKKPHEARFRHVQRGTDVPLRGNGMRRNKRRTLPHFSRHNQAGSLELPRPFFVPRYL